MNSKPRSLSLKNILNVLVAISASAAIYFEFVDEHAIFSILKPLTTILIILIPILFWNKALKQYNTLLIIALVFCLFGDIFLLNDSQFVFGLSAFLIAHIFFLLSFVRLGGVKYYYAPLIILAIFGISFFAFLYGKLDGLVMPVFVYFLFIIAMCWQGVSLYIWKKKAHFFWMGLAVVLFLISDSLIAVNKFVVPFELARPVILSTYWLSIALLANSIHALKPD